MWGGIWNSQELGHVTWMETYSEQKNWFTKGQILLVSQFMAQGTKVNGCEFFITKMDTLSFVTLKYRTLVPAIGSIYILQLGTLNESVFFFFMLCCCFCTARRGRTSCWQGPCLRASAGLLELSHRQTGRKDFKSASGVGPLQDSLPELPSHVQ